MRSMRAGQVHPMRARIAALIPRTARERRYAAAVAVTAGITEEILFRGALIALGIEIFHLPATAAAALSLILFAGVHAYQGRLGMLSAGFLGFGFTAVTVLGGSLLPAIVMHIAADLCALLVVPAEPTPRPAEAAQSGEKTEAVVVGTLEEAVPFKDTVPAPTEDRLTGAPLTAPEIRSPAPGQATRNAG